MNVKVTYVSRVHDMGDQTGFGPVPVGEDSEPAFAADWVQRGYRIVELRPDEVVAA